MRVHHLNAGTMCPVSARLVNGEGGWLSRGRLVCHVLLVESRSGLVLVDAGMGLADLADPGRLGRGFVRLTAPRCSPDEAAVSRVRALGFDPAEVRHVIPTHLDRDHAGGIEDFPEAQIHLHRLEYEGARRNTRYRPAHLSHLEATDLRVYDDGGESWFGFSGVRALDERAPEILLVPLRGHTRGHCGVAVRADGRWLLHAGDAYFHRGQVQPGGIAPAGLRAFQRLADADTRQRAANQARLRELAVGHGAEVEVFCAHDPHELGRYR